MTVSDKKKILNGYGENILAAQRLKADLDRYTASAASIQREIDRYLAQAEDIEGIIGLVKDNFKREILLRKYIYGETFESMGLSLGYSSRQLQRIINRAVSELRLDMIA